MPFVCLFFFGDNEEEGNSINLSTSIKMLVRCARTAHTLWTAHICWDICCWCAGTAQSVLVSLISSCLATRTQSRLIHSNYILHLIVVLWLWWDTSRASWKSRSPFVKFIQEKSFSDTDSLKLRITLANLPHETNEINRKFAQTGVSVVLRFPTITWSCVKENY